MLQIYVLSDIIIHYFPIKIQNAIIYLLDKGMRCIKSLIFKIMFPKTKKKVKSTILDKQYSFIEFKKNNVISPFS